MRAIASGLTVKQIGDKLCLSVKTISTYRARILEKTDLKSNADLVKKMDRHIKMARHRKETGAIRRTT